MDVSSVGAQCVLTCQRVLLFICFIFFMFDEFQLLEGGELVHAQQDWRSSLPGEAGRVRC